MGKILIIDDDEMMCASLSKLINRLEHECFCANRLNEGKKILAADIFDIVLLDVQLPDGSGLDLLPEIDKLPSPPEVIIITSAGDPDGAELAIKGGAWDYIEKPFSVHAITLEINRALEYHTTKMQASPLLILREKIIGNSPALKKSINLMAKAARTDASVLVTGESGTGKELFARAVHENSFRSNKDFVVVDCGAISSNLIESQLFGYKKGAFTGAVRDMEGLVKQADGGTLFIDEVGELSLDFQKVFLRTLQEHRFRPLGALKEDKSDFRLIVATNRDLQQMVQESRFRGDLLFRLRSIVIEIPPLRQRQEDIKDICLHYASEFCARNNIEIKGFSDDFFEVLSNYQWPGNVRELIHALEWMITEHHNANEYTPKHLPEDIRIQLLRSSIKNDFSAVEKKQDQPVSLDLFQSLKEVREKAVSVIEKEYLQNLISAVDGNVPEACRISRLSRTHFYSLLKKHTISLKK